MNDEESSEPKLIGNNPDNNGPPGPQFWGNMMQYQSYPSSSPLLAHSIYLSQLNSMGYPPPTYPINPYNLPAAPSGHFHMGQADPLGASTVAPGDQITADRLSSIERRK